VRGRGVEHGRDVVSKGLRGADAEARPCAPSAVGGGARDVQRWRREKERRKAAAEMRRRAVGRGRKAELGARNGGYAVWECGGDGGCLGSTR
jgi:hypothetical protein